VVVATRQTPPRPVRPSTGEPDRALLALEAVEAPVDAPVGAAGGKPALRSTLGMAIVGTATTVIESSTVPTT